MKFQIVLETTDVKKATMSSDEFEKLIQKSLKLDGFKVIGARPLQGIQAKVWEPASARRGYERDPLE